MKLIKRLEVDLRNSIVVADNEVNEALIALQTFEDGKRNKVDIIDINEVVKDSGIVVFLIIYDDKGLDKVVDKK